MGGLFGGGGSQFPPGAFDVFKAAATREQDRVAKEKSDAEAADAEKRSRDFLSVAGAKSNDYRERLALQARSQSGNSILGSG